MINAPIVRIAKTIDKAGVNVKLAPPKNSSSNTPNTKPINPIHTDVNTAINAFFIQSHSFVKLELAYFNSNTLSKVWVEFSKLHTKLYLPDTASAGMVK